MPSRLSGKHLVYDQEGAFWGGQLALPNFDDCPPALLEKLPISLVASHIRTKFFGPEALVRRWDGRARSTGMPMPEATVHEHSNV